MPQPKANDARRNRALNWATQQWHMRREASQGGWQGRGDSPGRGGKGKGKGKPTGS